jgi:dihydrofolate reductase
MRRLIVQMQISVDGFVASDPPDLDWTVWDWGPDCPWDADLQRDFNAVYDSVDTILLSRVMIEEGFLTHWTAAAAEHPDDALYAFARRIVEIEKVVASSELADAPWPLTRIVGGPLAAEVATLKAEAGGDIICFGGVRFAAALLAQRLVDVLELFVNPTAVHGGRSIFDDVLHLRLAGSKAYECGIVVNQYAPAAAADSSLSDRRVGRV